MKLPIMYIELKTHPGGHDDFDQEPARAEGRSDRLMQALLVCLRCFRGNL